MVKQKVFILCIIVCCVLGCKASAQENDDAVWKMGFLNEKGEVVIPFEYDDAQMFSEGLAPVCKNDKWGYIDTTGEEKIQLQFDFASHFLEGLAVVANNKKFGYIDTSGKIAIPLEYEGASVFYKGYATVKKNGKTGVIDTKGNIIIPFEYSNYTLYADGLFCLSKDHKERYLTKEGKTVGNVYDDATPFYNGVARIRKGRQYFVINRDFDIIAEQEGNSINRRHLSFYYYNKYSAFEFNKDFKEYRNKGLFLFDSFYDSGLIRSLKESKYGFVNQKGETIIPHEYEYVTNFNNGLALVKKNNKSFIINTKNEKKKSINYNVVSTVFSDSKLFMFKDQKNNTIGYIDFDGNVVYESNIKNARFFDNGYAIISDGVLWGALNESGKLIIPIEYGKLGPFSEGFFVAGKVFPK